MEYVVLIILIHNCENGLYRGSENFNILYMPLLIILNWWLATDTTTPATSSVEEEQCMGPREPPFCDSLRASSARGIDSPTGLLPHRFIKQVSSISKAYHFAPILLCDSPSLLVIVWAKLPSWHGGEALIWWSTHNNLTYWKGVPLCSV